MKRKLWIIFVVLGLMMASYWTGSYVKQQRYNDGRMRRCNILLCFALDKAEYMDISHQGTMEALISNLYAAYEFCDDAEVKAQLHDLWNELIDNCDFYVGREALLVNQINTILEQLEMIK